MKEKVNKLNLLKAEGILSGYTTNKEKNVISLTIKTDSLTEEQVSMLRELYQKGRGNFKPKAELKITFNETYKMLGAYKNAY